MLNDPPKRWQIPSWVGDEERCCDALSESFNSWHPGPLHPWREKQLHPELWYIIWGSVGSFTSVVEMRRVLRYGESDRPCRAEPKLWCGVYSRPSTKTASLPSVVLIKKTAHVKIKQQQQAVCIFRGACVREWGQKNAFPQRKNPPTAFTKLLHLLPGWLCSPDCLIFLTVSFQYMQCTAVHGAAAVHTGLTGKRRRRGRPLKLPKTRRRKRRLAFRQRNDHICALLGVLWSGHFMLFWTNLPCDMAQHQSNQPPPQPLRAKAAAFGCNEKKKESSQR